MRLQGLYFPDDLFYAAKHNLWLREEDDGSVTVGMTAYGCAIYGQIFAFTPKRAGLHIESDRSFGIVEFAKAASSARSPLAATVIQGNDAVVARPGLINRDCYGEGWMIRLQPDDWSAAKTILVRGDAALSAFERRMMLDNFDPEAPGVQALIAKDYPE